MPSPAELVSGVKATHADHAAKAAALAQALAAEQSSAAGQAAADKSLADDLTANGPIVDAGVAEVDLYEAAPDAPGYAVRAVRTTAAPAPVPVPDPNAPAPAPQS